MGRNEKATVWVMSPDKKVIQKRLYDFELRSKFPRGFECRQFCINDIMDYYVVFFDAEEGGDYNASAKWIASHCGVEPTGNFVILHKKWIQFSDGDCEEYTVDMDITPKEFKKQYLK